VGGVGASVALLDQEGSMENRSLKNRGGTAISPAAIEGFRQAFAGRALLAGDSGYEEARHIWNAAIDRHPGLIARCRGVADVAATIRFARVNDIAVAIRGGGHNVGGRALCDDGIVVDLTDMNAVVVDPVKRIVDVQGGATLGDVDRETHVYGLAVPAGVISKTGIAGLTLGGGVGWLVRRYGLACDNVVSFEVVTAEGVPVTASRESNPDLYWALRGGGGNFGVVTCFRFRAYPVSNILGGMIVHPRDQAGRVLRHYRDFVQEAPEALTAYAALIHTPDGVPAVAIVACYSGDMKEGERVLAPLRGFGSPMVDAIQPMPFPAMQQLLDGAFPAGNRNYWKSAFFNELDDGAIDIMVDHANRAGSPLSAVVIEYYAGAAARVPASEAAFAQRNARYLVGMMAQWTDRSEDDRHVAWARGLFDELQPHSTGRYMLNYLGEEGADVIRAAFGASYDRLVEVKNRFDPDNFFRQNQNIAPTGRAA
jgi:FAD/FMN-containing dehydrogenase